MAVGSYKIYDLTAAAFQKDGGSGTVTDVALEFTNKVDLKPDDATITFEGDGQTKKVFITTGLTVECSPDSLNVAAMASLFSKSTVTTGLPASYTSGVWFGEATQTAGKTAGFWVEANAIKVLSGVESQVTIRIWVPLGTLTLGNAPGVETSKKADKVMLRLSASRATKDVAGNALPSVPTGGAYYIVLEK